MIKRKLFLGLATGIGMLALAGCAGGGAADSSGAGAGTLEEMEPLTLRVSDVSPETASSSRALAEWMDYVTEETGGKITFDTYYSGTLHGGGEGLSALDQGLTDITFYFPGYFAEELPIANWVMRDFASTAAVGFPFTSLAGSAASQTLYEESEDLQAELAAHNAVVLGLWSGATPDLLCVDPAASLDSLDGRLVNAGGPQWVAQVEELGMIPEVVEVSEEYEALQRGVVECTISTAPPIVTRGLGEVAQEYFPTELSPGITTGYIFNKELWDSLPLEVQQIMHDGKHFITGGFNKMAVGDYPKFVEEAKSLGIVFNDPAELNEVLAELRPTAEEVVAAAPEGAKNAQADFQLFSEQVTAWKQLAVDELGIPEVEKTPENIVELYQSAADINWEQLNTALTAEFEQYRPE